MKLPDLGRWLAEHQGVPAAPPVRRTPLFLMSKKRQRAPKGVLVRNLWGQPLPCCWNECMRPGRTDHEVRVQHDAPDRRQDTLTYLFCSDAHKAMWLTALEPGEYGRIRSGQVSALGLIVP